MSDTKRLYTLLTIEESHAKLQGDNFVLKERIDDLEKELGKSTMEGAFQIAERKILRRKLAKAQAENERLREMNEHLADSDSVKCLQDADLLKRYIAHVTMQEGTDFLDVIYQGKGMHSGVPFTDDELAELRALSDVGLEEFNQ